MIFAKLAFFPLTVLTEERWVMKSSWGEERETRGLLFFFKLLLCQYCSEKSALKPKFPSSSSLQHPETSRCVRWADLILIFGVWEGGAKGQRQAGQDVGRLPLQPSPFHRSPPASDRSPKGKPLLPSPFSPFPLLHRIPGLSHFAHNLTPSSSPLQQSYHIWARQLGCRTEAEMEPG